MFYTQAGMYMNMPADLEPLTKNVYWSKKWYEFWKTSIKVID